MASRAVQAIKSREDDIEAAQPYIDANEGTVIHEVQV
jgi:hypothetical protein